LFRLDDECLQIKFTCIYLFFYEFRLIDDLFRIHDYISLFFRYDTLVTEHKVNLRREIWAEYINIILKESTVLKDENTLIDLANTGPKLGQVYNVSFKGKRKRSP
jgi:hypothetical protein